MRSTRKNYMSLAIFLLVTSLLLAGCGSGGTSNSISQNASSDYDRPQAVSEDYYGLAGSYDYEMNSIADESGYNSSDTGGTGAVNAASLELSKEKLVYTTNITAETLEFEQSQTCLLETIEQYEGIVQSQNFSDDTSLTYYEDDNYKRRTLILTARIPSAHFVNFTTAVGDIGYIRNSHSSVENISQRYYDTQTRLNSLTVQEERLLQMLQDADSVEEMIQVEARLSEVQYQIDSASTALQYMDTDVAFSTVTINLFEVHKYSNIPSHRLNFGERLLSNLQSAGHSFLNVLEWLLTAFIYLFPYLIFIAAAIWLIHLRRKRKRERLYDNDNQ